MTRRPQRGPRSANGNTRSAARPRRARRWFWRIFWGWIALVCLVVFGLHAALGTASGRALLLDLSLPLLNRSIPGQVEVDRLDRLDTGGLRLGGARVIDPLGVEVVSIDHLALSWDLFAALSGRYILRRVELDGGFADLWREAPGGLVASFVEPEEPPAEEPLEDEPSPYVRVDRLSISNLELLAPELPQVGSLAFRNIQLEASFELDEVPQGRLHHLALRIERGELLLGSIDEAKAVLAPEGDVSSFEVQAQLLESSLRAEAELVLPPAPHWLDHTLRGGLHVTGVTSNALAILLQDPSYARAFQGTIGWDARFFGTPRAPELVSELHTAAGPLRVDARLDAGKRAHLRIRSGTLALAELRSDLTARRVAFLVTATADLGDLPSVPVRISVPRASLDEEPLPTLDLQATVSPTAISELRLRAADDLSRLILRGSVTLRGRGELRGMGQLHADTAGRLFDLFNVPATAGGWTTLRFSARRGADEQVTFLGEAQAEGLRYGAHELGEGHARWNLNGNLRGLEEGHVPALQGTLQLEIEEAKVSGEPIFQAGVLLHGGPDRYELWVRGEARAISAHGGFLLQRKGEEIRLSGKVEGWREGRPYEVEVGETNVTLDPVLRTEGISLHYEGQRLSLVGQASTQELALRLDTDFWELSDITHLLGQEPEWSGRARLTAELRGSPSTPAASLKTTVLGASMLGRPPVSARAEAAFDAAKGSLAFEVTARESDARSTRPRLQLSAQGEYDFPGGSGWSERLQQGYGEARATLSELDFSFAAPWLSTAALPAIGSIRAEAAASGTLQAPRLEAQVDSTFRLRKAHEPLTVEGRLELDEGRAHLFARLRDAAGSFGDLVVMGALPPITALPIDEPTTQRTPLDELRERLSAFPSAGEWAVHLITPKRTFFPPTSPVDPANVPPLSYVGELWVHHQPHREPEGFLLAQLQQAGPYPEASRCGGGPWLVELETRWTEGHLTSRAEASTPKGALSAEAGMSLELQPALAGQHLMLGPITARVDAGELPLHSVPFLCEQAQGEASLTAQLKDPLGSSPSFETQIDLRRFTLGDPNTIDLRVDARADSDQATLDVLAGDPKRPPSEIRVQVPLEWSDGSFVLREEAELRGLVRLRNLPIAPLLDPGGPISYATGFLDGHIDLAGSVREPQLGGLIDLRDVAFTATDVGQPLSDVQGRFRFSERRILLQGLRAHDRGGSLRIDGDVTLNGLETISAHFHVRADDFPLRQLGQVLATTDVAAEVFTEIGPEETSVRLLLDDVNTWIESTELRTGISLDPHPDLVIDGKAADYEPMAAAKSPEPMPPPHLHESPPSTPVPSPPDPAPEERLTRIEVETRGRFWVNREDFAVRLDATLEAETRGEETRIFGDVVIDRGTVVLLGRVFDVERGSRLEFVGSSPPDPVLDLTLFHDNRRTGERISLRIGGRGSAPELTFLVDGRETDAGEALLAIYGSQRTSQDPATVEHQAAGFVGGLAAGILATSARRRLGSAAPILMIDPGGPFGEGRVRAGFELDALIPRFLRGFIMGVYLEGIVAREGALPEEAPPTATQQESRVQGGVLLEFYLPNNFFNTNQYGPGATWSVDLGWQL